MDGKRRDNFEIFKFDKISKFLFFSSLASVCNVSHFNFATEAGKFDERDTANGSSRNKGMNRSTSIK